MSVSAVLGERQIAETPAGTIEYRERGRGSPVVFVHGLWLLPSSWNRWAALFDQAGYPAVTPGWPDDPETVDEANAHPEVFAHKSVGQVADHYAAPYDLLAQALEVPPARVRLGPCSAPGPSRRRAAAARKKRGTTFAVTWSLVLGS